MTAQKFLLKVSYLTLLLIMLVATVKAQPPVSPTFQTPLAADNLDPAAFAAWVDGAEAPLAMQDGPRHVIWTQTTPPQWDGVRFGESKQPGTRYLRLGWKTPLPVGSVLARAGGAVSVLKATAMYPGNLADDSQWIPAQRLRGGQIGQAEAGDEEYALWVLPPGTSTRAVRFSHTAKATDDKYSGWLGGVYLLSERMANVAPEAVAAVSERNEVAALLNNGSNDRTWGAWDNGPEGAAQTVSPEHPAWVTLAWAQPVQLRGLNVLWAGFSAAEAQTYIGPGNRSPREAKETDWQTLKSFDSIENQYPRALGVNWLDFGHTITTRAIRLRLTKVTQESHPHLNGNTKGGKRVWLGELMALQPLGNATLHTAVLTTPTVTAHPPIPIRFTLKEPGYVTLVIEDATGHRIRNLVAETLYPAGQNVAWWDGTNDLLRDEAAAHHGLYHIPTQFVAPGTYHVRGLYRKALDLRYEFSIYSGGHPAWETADGTGGWLTNHTPPSSALFVPANQAPGGKPLVFLGSYVSEGGSGLAWVDLNGVKQGGRGWVGGNWTAAPYLARDTGAKSTPDSYAYVGAAWEGELRLTALTPNGDRAVLTPTFKFPGTSDQEKKDSSALGGFAVYNGLLAASLPKQNQLLFVDAALHTQRAVVPLPDGRGLTFDNQGRLLALSGPRLLRYTLPAPLAPARRLNDPTWTATASVHPEDAAKAIDADANSRWSTNGWQAPGQWFSLDLKMPQTFSMLVLSSSADRDSPKSYEVAVSDDGQTWKSIATGQGTPSVTSIKLPMTTARFLKITQTGTTQDSYWSLNALELYNVPPGAGDAVALSVPEVLVGTGLEDPQGITLDAQGNIYISDRGNSHQVKVFDSTGKLLRAIGHAGVPQAGPYDVEHMNNPKGLALDDAGHLWVTEEDFQPKRVSVWTADGRLWKSFYGPARYGGGGKLDPKDKTRFYYDGMEFKLDWKAGTDQVTGIISRPRPGDLQMPDGFGGNGSPEAPIYVNGRQYMTNCYNSNPTNGASIAMLWVMKNSIAVPVAACGRANDWTVLKDKAFKAQWPAGIDLNGDYWKNQTLFLWSDLNGDAQVQPNEVTFVKAEVGGITVMPDGAFLASRVDGKTTRFAPKQFTAQGVPIYDLTVGQTLAADAQGPVTSGGDQALQGTGGWTILTAVPKPFSPLSVAGVKNGVALWSYPSVWPGLHASHEAPTPDHPGELIGTTRLLGGLVTPRVGDAGPLWAVNGNMGNMYLLTQDGLFVGQLFQDVRQGKSWTMPIAQRNMLLNDVSLHDENFWPTITQTADGQVYLNSGSRGLVRVDGLDSIRRFPDTSLRVTADDLKQAQTYFAQSEAQRQQAQGQGTLKVALRPTAPTVDGKLDDWDGAEWATIDKSGVAANFDSRSKPYDVTAAVTVSGDRLYAAFRTTEPDLLRNTDETPNAPFKTGGALDIMLGADANADARRTQSVAGDERLLITRVKDKPLALLYRAVVPGTKEPVPFSSPWRTITLDRVDNVSDQIQYADDGKGNYEISVPLAALGLKPQAGTTIKGDIGILRGNGFETLQRVYWSNKATGITADVPSEAMLTPQLWGKWEFQTTP